MFQHEEDSFGSKRERPEATTANADSASTDTLAKVLARCAQLHLSPMPFADTKTGVPQTGPKQLSHFARSSGIFLQEVSVNDQPLPEAVVVISASVRSMQASAGKRLVKAGDLPPKKINF